MSPTLGENNRESFGDRQFVVIASEKQARVVALPSQTCIYRQQLVDSEFVVKAETISIKGNISIVQIHQVYVCMCVLYCRQCMSRVLCIEWTPDSVQFTKLTATRRH